MIDKSKVLINDDKKYICTDCGGNAFIGYSNWSKAGSKKKIVKKNERICSMCFKKRTTFLVF